MNLADAVEAATKKGMRLPKVDEPFVEPARSRSWAEHPDGTHSLGMEAARAGEGTSDKVAPGYIDVAVSLGSIAMFALSLLVLDPMVKFGVVSYQIETFNGSRTYALLSGASLLRALACVTVCRGSYDAYEALHRIFYYIWNRMKGVKPAPGKPPLSKGRALQIVFSVTLFFAESIFKGNSDALSVIETIRSVLGATALCAFAARNASYHSCEALDDLEGFWNKMDLATSKDAVESIFSGPLQMFQNGGFPCLIISQCGWCRQTGWPVLAATACIVSSPEIMMKGMARLVVSPAQRFFTYCRLIHCGLSGQKPEGVGATQYLLDLALRIPHMRMDKLFGLNGHSNVNLGSTVCMVPLLDACAERGFLMGAGVGIFQTLPLLDRKVFRAIFDLLKRAPIVTGDHGIIEALFGQEQKWVPGPLWK